MAVQSSTFVTVRHIRQAMRCFERKFLKDFHDCGDSPEVYQSRSRRLASIEVGGYWHSLVVVADVAKMSFGRLALVATRPRQRTQASGLGTRPTQ